MEENEKKEEEKEIKEEEGEEEVTVYIDTASEASKY